MSEAIFSFQSWIPWASRRFAGERRKKDQDLANQIRTKKGDYNSGPNGRRREGDPGASEGRREGDYDKKPFDKRPFDKKPMNDSPPTPNGGVHHSQVSDAFQAEYERECAEIKGYTVGGDASKFLTTAQANRLLVNNPDLPTELLKALKPAIKRGDVIELIRQQ